jgi:RNA-binding protein YhbY
MSLVFTLHPVFHVGSGVLDDSLINNIATAADHTQLTPTEPKGENTRNS